MFRYAKITDPNTNECAVGLGNADDYYKSIGMEKRNVCQAYDGRWFIEGFVPEKPVEELEKEVRAFRDELLNKTDFSQLPDTPVSEEEKEKYRRYRQYLRDVPKSEKFPREKVLSFEEWNG